MRRSLVPLAMLAAAFLMASCGQQYPNPFEGGSRIVAPSAQTDLIFVTNGYSPVASAPREVFAVGDDGAALAQVTYCSASQKCDSLEAAPAPDRRRMVVRRAFDDTNKDGKVDGADDAGLTIVDYARGVEGELLPPSRRISAVDWSPQDGVIVYSAPGTMQAAEELYRVDPTGTGDTALTFTSSVRERRPRIDPSGSVAVFERIDLAGDLKGRIFVFVSGLSQVKVTDGGPGTEALAGTPYIVGADADPDFSPDGHSVVFRRLTATGNAGRGTWDIMTARTDGSELRVVASGPAYRGAPDWDERGLLFPETDLTGSRLVTVQPDGTGRKVLVTFGTGVEIGVPRWLVPQ